MAAKARAKITERVLDNMVEGEVIYDAEIKGFAARRGKTGISITLKYSINTRQRIATIGILGDGGLTLTTARKQAEVLRGQVRAGIDPMAARDTARASMTLKEYADRFQKEHVARIKPSSRRGYEQMLRLHILPTLGRLRIDAIALPDIRKWHSAMSEIPPSANFALRVLSKMLSIAVQDGLLTGNPARGVKKFPVRKIERYLNDDEAQRLWQALGEIETDTSTSPLWVAGIRLLLLTGARYGEIFQCRWAWVDFERSIIRFPSGRAKTDDRVIHLSPEALEILKALPRLKGNPYVIAGAKPGQPYIAKSRPWKQLLARAEIEEFRMHDMRHSFASTAVGSGVPLFTVGALLGHASPTTTKRYAHLAPGHIKDAAASVSAMVASAGQKKKP